MNGKKPMSKSLKTLSKNDANLLLDALLGGTEPEPTPGKKIRNYTIAMVMLETGLRVGEVVKLNLADLFYLERPVNTITISESISKTKHERQIPVSNRLLMALEIYKDSLVQEGLQSPHRPAFFGKTLLKPITTRQIERTIRAAGQKALGRLIHPHMLRHTFATRLMRCTNIRVVQELLGHKHIRSTQAYTHPGQEEMKTAINAVENQ